MINKNNNNMILMFKKYKKIIFILLAIVICSVGFIKIRNDFGIAMTVSQKKNRIYDFLEDNKYDKARELTEQYFQNDYITKAAFRKYIDEEEWRHLTYFKEEPKKVDKDEEAIDNLKIDNVYFEEDSWGKRYAKIKVENIGEKEINYIAVKLSYSDADGNFIRGGYVNSSNTLNPNCAVILSTEVDYTVIDVKGAKVNATIDKAKYKE